MRIQLLPRHAGLDAAVHVRLAHVQHRGHARQVDGDAAADRGDVAFERRAGAPGHHGDAFGVAEGEQAGNFLGGFDERHGVGHRRGLRVLAVRVVIAQRRVGGDALAQEGAGGFDDGGDGHDGPLGGVVRENWTDTALVASAGLPLAGKKVFHAERRSGPQKMHKDVVCVGVLGALFAVLGGLCDERHGLSSGLSLPVGVPTAPSALNSADQQTVP